MTKKEITNRKGEVFYEAKGVIRSFNEQTGYGFIFTTEEPDKDIFFHYTQVLLPDKKEVKVGDKVEFLYKEVDNKGLRAFTIKIIK